MTYFPLLLGYFQGDIGICLSFREVVIFVWNHSCFLLSSVRHMFTSGDPLHSPYALQDGVASLMLGFRRDEERLTATGVRHIRISLSFVWWWTCSASKFTAMVKYSVGKPWAAQENQQFVCSWSLVTKKVLYRLMPTVFSRGCQLLLNPQDREATTTTTTTRTRTRTARTRAATTIPRS